MEDYLKAARHAMNMIHTKRTAEGQSRLVAKAQAYAIIALVERLDKLIEMGTEYGLAQLDLQGRR